MTDPILLAHNCSTITVIVSAPLPTGVLREIQERPMEMLRRRDQDAIRMSLFPNLDYPALHQSLVALVDIMPLIQTGTQGGLLASNLINKIIDNWNVFHLIETFWSILKLIGWQDFHHVQVITSLM